VAKADRVTAALLFALAAAFSAAALRLYPYSSEGGPGSGFLPFWLGLAMAALALMLFLRRAPPAGEWFPTGEGRIRLVVVLGLTIAFVALLKPLGMVLATTLYLIAIVRFFGGHAWWVAVTVGIGAAGFNYLVFAHWLRVPFPQGIFWTS
jgi:putative tricarboxylic transport membrane protein